MPQAAATAAGLTVTELDHAVVYPSALFAKPVLCVQDYVLSLRAYCSKGTDKDSGLNLRSREWEG